MSDNEDILKELPSGEIIKIALAESKLVEFAKQAWHILEPTTPFIDGWHIHAICDHLEAVTRKEIRNLIINIPPRHCKSLLVSVFWFCWTWVNYPSTRWLFSSYAQDLSTRDSLKCRRILQSTWFTDRWGHKFNINTDANMKTRFENNKSGYRLATSVDGLVTGEGGDFVVCIPEGYLITTDKGKIDIKEIVENNLPVKILSYNHDTEKTEFKNIEAYEQRETDEIIKIRFGQSIVLECTPDHLIYAIGQGYKKAELLEVDDFILQESIINVVKSIKRKVGRRKVYNIRISDNHNYFVNGVLTHNCDDAHNVKQTESDVVRIGTLKWWDESMSSRLNNPKTGCKVIIMQRLHENDLTGHILEKEGHNYVHLRLPARYESDNKCKTIINFQDPRTYDGEPLWKDLYGEQELTKLENDLGSEYAIAGQLQQRPSARGGGLFKTEKFVYVNNIHPTEIVRSVRYWDKGGTLEGAQTCGCLMHKMKDNSFVIADMISGNWLAPRREEIIKETAINDGRKVVVYTEQEPGSGGLESAKSTIKNLQGFVCGRDKVTGSKELRAEPYSTQVEIGNVKLKVAKWNKDFIKQHEFFPMGRLKDKVDSASGAFNMLAGKGRAGTWGKKI